MTDDALLRLLIESLPGLVLLAAIYWGKPL